MMQIDRKVGKRFSAVLLSAGLLMIAPESFAASLFDEAKKMNRKEISTEEARSRTGDEGEKPRNKIAMRRMQLEDQNLDWDADPTAIPSFIYQAKKRTGLPAKVNNEGLKPGTDELFKYTTAYMTGHNNWNLTDQEVENLRRWIKRGGTLYLDDCHKYGSAFGAAWRSQIRKIFPGSEFRWLTEDAALVNKAFDLLYDMPWPGKTGAFYNQQWQYVVVNDRPAIFFSPNDDGCAWEYSTPPTAANPLGAPIGHGGDNEERELKFKWSTSWLLFAYMH